MQKKPFDLEQVQKLRKILKGRDRVLFSLGFDSVLRRSDLLTLRVSDVLDHQGHPKARSTKVMEKTGRRITFAISEFTRKLLRPYVKEKGLSHEDYLFKSRGTHLSGIQYSRLVKKWAMLISLDHKEFSTHSIRRSKSSAVYSATKDIEVCRQLLGHQSVANTSLYLNVSVENALDLVDELGF